MNSEQFNDLRRESTERLVDKCNKLRDAMVLQVQESDVTLQEHAEHIVNQELIARADSGEILELSDDEIDLLKAYRQFVATHNPGSTFGWCTPPIPKDTVVLPDQGVTGIIQDPRVVEHFGLPPELVQPQDSNLPPQTEPIKRDQLINAERIL
jgi:hypothetical protein